MSAFQAGSEVGPTGGKKTALPLDGHLMGNSEVWGWIMDTWCKTPQLENIPVLGGHARLMELRIEKIAAQGFDWNINYIFSAPPERITLHPSSYWEHEDGSYAENTNFCQVNNCQGKPLEQSENVLDLLSTQYLNVLLPTVEASSNEWLMNLVESVRETYEQFV